MGGGESRIAEYESLGYPGAEYYAVHLPGRCGFLMPVSVVPCARRSGHPGDHEAPRAKGPKRENAARYNHSLQGKAVTLLRNARTRAAERNLPFDLELDWVLTGIRDVLADGCPLLGTPIFLDAGIAGSYHQPSIDRFYPDEGYVRSNCLIVSRKANTIKQDIPPAVLKRVGDNVEYLRLTRFAREERDERDG